MPSEAEWEFACRAGTTTRYYWGDQRDDAYFWYHFNSGARIHEVTEHESKPNAFGLVDMSGNVFEWCQHDFINNYNDGPDTHLPRGDGSAHGRVMRGGCWNYSASDCSSAHRGWGLAVASHNYNGFRLSRRIA